ncbi:fumarylacetoacetate hydrolase family protein [Kibdelosporangium philippinense]|uniref:Fumarylacetoacetate hydrolase family protein n=1 Tax=Kibdelosporangium philippinense TaxID=211113 RepID=A0ABS8Z0Y9_9PSEU|nr:fumarylacetoacetate hydrolase family protein [Kibdelosporangium philippinense]MCE7001626.1 fumarylacetoacetate hydrolase family protein [Kibdelosporangium philippinense]
MRFANICGRLSLVTWSSTVVDLAEASGGQFGPNPQSGYEQWPRLLDFVRSLDLATVPTRQVSREEFGNPVPAPRQVFAIGLNYADHAAESSFAVPESPAVFTKYVTSLTGPTGEIKLPAGDVDWEVELVVVIGRRAEGVNAAQAWDHIAGVTVGQDISERVLQRVGPAPQFSLAKSYPGFGPMGPVVVTPDELEDPDALELGCLVNGEKVQAGSTTDLVFSVPELVERLSAVTPLLPGDVIFTGTPAGVGIGRTPPRFLKPGDELVSYITGIGEMRHVMVAS